jgi:chromosome segregation ATPase
MSEHVEAIRRETEALERQLGAREAEIALLRAEVRVLQRKADEAGKRATKATAASERLRNVIAGIREVTDALTDLDEPPRAPAQERVLAGIRDGLSGRAAPDEATARVMRTLAGEAAP